MAHKKDLSNNHPSPPNEAGILIDGQFIPDHPAKAKPSGDDALTEAAATEAVEQNKPAPVEPDAAGDILGDPTLPAGIQTGQTTRGAYSTDQSTGAGGYRDHRSGLFGTDGVAQPGNDEGIEPDAAEKGF